MPEYIDKEKLYQYLDNEVEWRNNQDRLFALEVVSDFHAADVAPVVHGRWNNPYISFLYPFKIRNPYCFCTNCCYAAKIKKISRYCPNCGAKMFSEDK